MGGPVSGEEPQDLVKPIAAELSKVSTSEHRFLFPLSLS